MPSYQKNKLILFFELNFWSFSREVWTVTLTFQPSIRPAEILYSYVCRKSFSIFKLSILDIHHLSDHLMDMDDTYRFLNLPSYLPDFTSKCRFRDSDERNLFWFYEPPLMLSTGANSFTDSGLSSDILVPTLESLKCFRELNMIPNQNLNRIWPRYWPWNDLQLIINISIDECRKSNSGPFNTKGLENSILSLTRYETVAYLFQIGQKSKSKKNWFDFFVRNGG